jgi:desulfoferrodoxin (superoxide reductase-like protein)
MNEMLVPGTEIKVDMTNVPDFHHREHHMDWITIKEVISGSWGFRYLCSCRDGFSLYADPENVRKLRAPR